MNRWATAGALLAVGIALLLRCPRLGQKPMHNDEGVNALKFGELWERGNYKYDPSEYHGPTLPYATALINRLTEAADYKNFTETRLRAVTVVFGTALILLYPFLCNALGRKAVIWAGIFTAVSPAMVYYGRYYIHEMLLVFFTGLGLVSGWRYWQSRKVGWSLLCGASVGLMQATKETFILSLAACALALGLNQFWNRQLDASGRPALAPRLSPGHILAGFVAWAVVWVILFSSFFTNPRGLVDSVATYQHWISRAGTSNQHVHEWWFYLQRLLFFHTDKGLSSEGLILPLALAGAGAGFFRKGLGYANASFVRFLSFYTLLLTAFYSLLSYKTPWCLLSFWLGFILLAGVGASVLINVAKFQWARLAAILALLVVTANLAWQAWQDSIDYASDRRNPYVYAPTSSNILQLVEKVEALANASAEKHNTIIKVMAPEGDFWPLPWYLRKFDHVGWYEKVPEDPFAPIMIVSAQFHANFDEKRTHAMVEMFELRPNVFFELYVEAGLWKRYVEELHR